MRNYARSLAQFFRLNLRNTSHRHFLYSLMDDWEFEAIAIEAAFRTIYKGGYYAEIKIS